MPGVTPSDDRGGFLSASAILREAIEGDLLEACVFLPRQLRAGDVDRLLLAVEDRLGIGLAQDRHGRVGLARLDPLRALVEGEAEGGAVSDSTPADPLARLDHQHVLVRRHKGARRGKAGDAGADDDDIEVGGTGRQGSAPAPTADINRRRRFIPSR